MAFACDEDDIALRGKHAGSADGFAAVGDGDHVGLLCGGEACEHVGDDVLRLFEAGIIAGDDDLVAALDSLLCHKGTLALVAVASSAHYGDDAAFASQYFVDGTQYIGNGIGGVSIVDNGGVALGSVQGFEAAVHGTQGAEHGEHLFGALAQQAGSAVYREQVAGVEFADELYEDLYAVDVEHHAIEVVFEDAALEVGQATL